MPNYAAWPTPADVSARLQAVGVTLRGEAEGQSPSRVRDTLAAVVAEVGHSTRHQFVAGPTPTVRLFDGTGTPALDVDPFVSLDRVSCLSGFGFPAWNYDLTAVQAVAEYDKPQTRLLIGQGSLATFGDGPPLLGAFYLFPAGRQNIQVSARWGYGASVPADLWEAVCGEAALRAVYEAQFDIAGRVVEEQFGDERRKYALPERDATGWHYAFKKALTNYKRSQAAKFKKLRGPML